MKANKMTWSAYFMFGTPEEKEEDIIETMNLIKEIEPSFVTIGTFYPIPDTEIFNELENSGELPKGLWITTSLVQDAEHTLCEILVAQKFPEIDETSNPYDRENKQRHHSDDPLFSEKSE